MHVMANDSKGKNAAEFTYPFLMRETPMTSRTKTKWLNAKIATLGFFLIASCAVAAPASPPTPEQSPEDIADLVMQWWPGDYDNARQISELRADGAPIWVEGAYEQGQKFGGHLPVKSHYRALDLPTFGERVLYLEEFTFETTPYRQRIYTVAVDDADNVRVKLWYFPDKTTYAGAWQDLSRINDLTLETMSPLPDNCDMYVEQHEDGRLHMMMPKEECVFGSSIFDYQVSLSESDFWFRDRIADSETGIVTMTAGSFTYHKLDKLN